MKSFQSIINSEKPVLVDFYAEWCSPCKMMAPVLKQVAQEMGDDVKVLKVDVDKNQDASLQYGIRSVPTLIIFQNGEVKWRNSGVMQAEQLKQIINQVSN